MTRPQDEGEGVAALGDMLGQDAPTAGYDPYDDPWAEPPTGAVPTRDADATSVRTQAPATSDEQFLDPAAPGYTSTRSGVDAPPVHPPSDYATDPRMRQHQPGYGYGQPEGAWAPAPTQPRRGGGPAPWIIGLALGALLLLAGVAGGLALLGGRDSADAEGPTVVTETQTTEVTSTDGSSSPSSSSDQRSSSSSPSRTRHTPPPGATTCGGSSAGGLKAAVGNEVTSCEFALNVRDAYVDAGGKGRRSVRAFSPKTGKAYTMTCQGDPVACTGGNNAVVYLY